jgi:hypothetical protein
MSLAQDWRRIRRANQAFYRAGHSSFSASFPLSRVVVQPVLLVVMRLLMQETAQLAGFLAADALLRVASGGTLRPLILFENDDGTSRIIVIEEPTPQQAAFKGETILRTNAGGAVRGVMAFDAYLNLPPGRTDAIFLQACQYDPQPQRILLAVPYRHASKPGGFAIRRPKFIAFDEKELPEAEVVAAFFRGVDKHEKGGPFWQEHYDEKDNKGRETT